MRWINSKALSYPFRAVAWDELAARLREATGLQPLLDVVDSVRAHGGRERLAGSWTVSGLVVTPSPVPDAPPIEHVIVSCLDGGAVAIEHRATSGHDDRLVRPAAEAVPLFWRFMIEKFGIAPVRPDGNRFDGGVSC